MMFFKIASFIHRKCLINRSFVIGVVIQRVSRSSALNKRTCYRVAAGMNSRNTVEVT